jgi:hypothetical protein
VLLGKDDNPPIKLVEQYPKSLVPVPSAIAEIQVEAKNTDQLQSWYLWQH